MFKKDLKKILSNEIAFKTDWDSVFQTTEIIGIDEAVDQIIALVKKEVIGRKEKEKYKKCPTNQHKNHEFCCFVGNIDGEARMRNNLRREQLERVIK